MTDLSGGRVNATRCAGCGENAGKNPDGTIRRYCSGFTGELDTYMCHHECHYPQVEVSPGGIGFLRTSAHKPSTDAAPTARRKAWVEAEPPTAELRCWHTPERPGIQPECGIHGEATLAPKGTTND